MLQIITYYIQSIYRWVLRCGYCRGFGIQSPSAYSFVRYVINEHYPYYAYQQFQDEIKVSSRLDNKLGRLFFRLANYWQPYYVLNGNNDCCPYVSAGCKSSIIRNIADFDFGDFSRRILVILDVNMMYDDRLREMLLSSATEHTLLVLENIRSDGRNKLLWRQLIEDKRAGITYDLYHCGIVFFDKSKHKQDFKINF